MIFDIVFLSSINQLTFYPFVLGFDRKIDIFEWMDEEAIKMLKEEREDCEAPKSHYTPKPNQNGKLFWFSGKRTCKILLGRSMLIHQFLHV